MLGKYNYLAEAKAAAQQAGPNRSQTTAQVLQPNIVGPKAKARGWLGTAPTGGPSDSDSRFMSAQRRCLMAIVLPLTPSSARGLRQMAKYTDLYGAESGHLVIFDRCA